jgi:hypothetical protein
MNIGDFEIIRSVYGPSFGSTIQKKKSTLSLWRSNEQGKGKKKKGCRTYWRYRESNTGWRGSGSEHYVFASHNATSYH